MESIVLFIVQMDNNIFDTVRKYTFCVYVVYCDYPARVKTVTTERDKKIDRRKNGQTDADTQQRETEERDRQ